MLEDLSSLSSSGVEGRVRWVLECAAGVIPAGFPLRVGVPLELEGFREVLRFEDRRYCHQERRFRFGAREVVVSTGGSNDAVGFSWWPRPFGMPSSRLLYVPLRFVSVEHDRGYHLLRSGGRLFECEALAALSGWEGVSFELVEVCATLVSDGLSPSAALDAARALSGDVSW